MKQKNIDVMANRERRKKDAVRGVLLFGFLQVITAVCFGAMCFIPDIPGWLGLVFGGLAVACLLLLIPAFVVLKQRFEEIEGGELDEAGQY